MEQQQKQDEGPSFEHLWNKVYPKDGIPHTDPKTGKECFGNQCAIRVSHVLLKIGVKPGGMKCWSCSTGGGHSIRATELAEWLLDNNVKGFSKAKALNGKDYFDYVEGKRGIIYFEDYWARAGENGDNRTGDHIDLWWGQTLKSNGAIVSWLQRNFSGITEPLGRSDLGKAKRVLFWEAIDE